MRRLAAILVLMCEFSAFGGWTFTNYVRALSVGVGNNSGTDWTNCITNFTASAGTVIANTLYMFSQDCRSPAAGAFMRLDANNVAFMDATVANHGTNAGWQDGFDTNGPAELDRIFMEHDNTFLIGQRGAYETNFPGYIPYHFRVHGVDTNAANAHIVIGEGGGQFYTNAVCDTLEIQSDNIPFTNTIPWGTSDYGINIRGVRPWGSNYFHNLWIHDVSGVCFQWQGVNSVIDHCTLARNGHARIVTGDTSDHTEILFAADGCDGTIIRYCLIEDWRSTGGLVWGNLTNGIQFYGNIVRQSGYWKNNGFDPGDADGFFDLLTSQTGPWQHVSIVGNTFANCSYGSRVAVQAVSANLIIENNLFYNCTNDALGGLSIGPRTGSSAPNVDYNWYALCGASPHRGDGITEAQEQDGPGNPFVSDTTGDLRLTAHTTPGDATVGAQYATDFFGNARTTWDRGGIEFTNASTPVVVVLPLNVRVLGH